MAPNSPYETARNLEAFAKTCTDKMSFIKKVYRGEEPVSMSVIDRCREAAMQINQSCHAYSTLLAEAKEHMSDGETDKSLDGAIQRETEVKEIKQTAEKFIQEIVSWVPAGVNARRIDTRP